MAACDDIGNDTPTLRATVARGEDWPLRLRVRENGEPVNLTPYTITATATKTGQTNVALSVAKTDAAGGIVDFALSAAQSAAMVAGASDDDLAGRWIVRITATDAANKTRHWLRVRMQIIT